MPEFLIHEVTAQEFGIGDDSPAADAVRRVTAACNEADRVTTLNEHTSMRLQRHGLDDARLWLAPEGFALVSGSAALDLVVHPAARGQGLGTALAELALRGVEHVEAWSHADHPAAARIATHFGVPRERELVVMRRPTDLPLEPTSLPSGVSIRTFRAADPAETRALLEINAAAFSRHPEQGDMSLAEFTERTRESWFDPEGLFVAVDDAGTMLGFHWTKVHHEEDPPIGEVYVVAVSPAAAGRGLGKALTEAGLRHLADLGLGEVILYVERDNEPALAVYGKQGFTRVRTEVQYRGTPTRTAGPEQTS